MIEGIIEIVGEVLLEGVFLIIKNENINKYLRYSLTGAVLFFYGFVIIGLFVVGAKVLKTSIIAGLFLMIASLFVLFSLIVTFKKSQDED